MDRGEAVYRESLVVDLSRSNGDTNGMEAEEAEDENKNEDCGQQTAST